MNNTLNTQHISNIKISVGLPRLCKTGEILGVRSSQHIYLGPEIHF
jgi:hypothetical protein